MPGQRPAAVLWDMDGTLIDTEPYWMAAERDLVAEFGGDWSDEDAHAVVGFDLLDSARYIIARSPVDLPPAEVVERLLDGVISRLATGVPWRPGARELLRDLQAAGIECALVTMSWRRFVEPVLALLPPGTFAAVVTGDEVSAGKPHPDPYLLAAELLGADPRRCVAIEDSPTGVASARAAGCAVLGIPNAREIDPQPGVTLRSSLVGLTPQDLADLLSAPLPRRSASARFVVPDLGFFRQRPAALLASLGLIAVALIGVGIARDRPAESPFGEIALDVWAPYWTLQNTSAELPSRIGAIRELSPFWYRANGVDRIEADPNVATGVADRFVEIAKERRNGSGQTRIVATVVDGLPAGEMAQILADPISRGRHVDALVDFVLTEDFDGVDIDYEQFAFADGQATWATTRPHWVSFITELAAALHSRTLTLTVSVPPIYDAGRTGASGYWVYDHAAIAEVVDNLRVMVYDFSTSRVGPIAPLEFVERSIAGTLAAVDDPSKVVLGIPAYGYNWPISTEGTCPGPTEGRTTVTTRSVHDLLARRGAEPVYQPLTAEWTFTYELVYAEGDQSCVQTRQVVYVDGDGLAARIELARRAGLGGVALWALGYEDGPVWEQILAAIS